MLLLISIADAEDLNMSIISMIESGGNAHAVSFLGAKYGRGLYQVSEVCLKEYNQYKKRDIKVSELFDSATCLRIANWYANTRVVQLLRHYNLPQSIKYKIYCYNWGIGNVLKWHNKGCVMSEVPSETINYLQRYLTMLNKVV